jgi:hypothetical protein
MIRIIHHIYLLLNSATEKRQRSGLINWERVTCVRCRTPSVCFRGSVAVTVVVTYMSSSNKVWKKYARKRPWLHLRAITMQRPRDKQVYQSCYWVTIANKHISTVTNWRAIIELLLETGFSILSIQRGYKEDSWSKNSSFGSEPPFREDLSPEAKD